MEPGRRGERIVITTPTNRGNWRVEGTDAELPACSIEGIFDRLPFARIAHGGGKTYAFLNIASQMWTDRWPPLNSANAINALENSSPA